VKSEANIREPTYKLVHCVATFRYADPSEPDIRNQARDLRHLRLLHTLTRDLSHRKTEAAPDRRSIHLAIKVRFCNKNVCGLAWTDDIDRCGMCVD
jgi:hypothetical protein